MGRKRREGRLHMPQYTGAPGCSGKGANSQSWSFSWSSLTLLGSQLCVCGGGGPHTADLQALSWAESHLQSLHLRSALFGVVVGRRRCGQVEGLGCWLDSWAFLDQWVLVLSPFRFGLS